VCQFVAEAIWRGGQQLVGAPDGLNEGRLLLGSNSVADVFDNHSSAEKWTMEDTYSRLFSPA
jgi:hypothetical protein